MQFRSMDQRRIYRVASALLARFGDPLEARIFCSQRAEARALAGSKRGRRIWRRIEVAVVTLSRKPDDGDRVH